LHTGEPYRPTMSVARDSYGQCINEIQHGSVIIYRKEQNQYPGKRTTAAAPERDDSRMEK
ncbi:hypothetical protein A2U01_0083305, partial [Trifolium medium]|nr:hypothetical protein [Trifolium medium]